MKDEYDFSQSIKNPYADKLKEAMTIQLEEEVVSYFEALAEETGTSYQTLINLYLKDCVKSQRKPSSEWVAQRCGSELSSELSLKAEITSHGPSSASYIVGSGSLFRAGFPVLKVGF